MADNVTVPKSAIEFNQMSLAGSWGREVVQTDDPECPWHAFDGNGKLLFKSPDEALAVRVAMIIGTPNE
ncbi:MAG: hypothetical protein WA910_12520 [Sphingopyxis granuli]